MVIKGAAALKNKKKSIAFGSIFAAAAVVPVAALAVVFYLSSKSNDFSPADVNIKISENNDTPLQTASKEFTLLSENSVYHTDKQVKIFESSESSKQLKVKLVPGWYDANGEICGNLGNISDFYRQKIEDDSLIFFNRYDDKIVECILDEHWDRNWEYNSFDGCFYYTGKFDEDNYTSVLMTGVDILPSVYENSAGYDLHIDVLADSVQDNEN